MERLIDNAAVEMGIESRRHPAAQTISAPLPRSPTRLRADTVYDSGEFTAVLDKALEAGDWKGFRKRRRASEKTRHAAGHQASGNTSR